MVVLEKFFLFRLYFFLFRLYFFLFRLYYRKNFYFFKKKRKKIFLIYATVNILTRSRYFF